MATNELLVGEPRLGWLIDGDSSTPEVAVMLQDTGDEIVLTVPFGGGFASSEPYARWFSAGIRFGDDTAGSHSYVPPPRVLLFHDTGGVVVLVGCRSAGMSSNLVTAGTGRIVCNFAVIGAMNLKYERINGLRTVMPALAAWTGLRSVRVDPKTDRESRVQRVEVSLESPPAVPLARVKNLSLWPSWETSHPDQAGSFAAHNVVGLQTMASKPATWREHLDGHLAIRELLAISGWQPFGFSRAWATRTDDPARLMPGATTGLQWTEVRSYGLRAHEDRERTPRFLFTFDDIGPVGVRRWLSLRRRYVQAIQPLVGLTDQDHTFLETRLVQSGIALEALGHQLAVDAGMNAKKQLSYNNALDLVLGDLLFNPIDGDFSEWKKRSNACYMGVKHPDRPVPDLLILLTTLREHLF